MNTTKLSPELAERLEHARGSALIDVVVELKPGSGEAPGGATRTERIASLRESFERDALPVEAVVRSAGGEVLGGTWLNRTIRARVPAGSVAPLARMDGVSLVDLPRPLLPESA